MARGTDRTVLQLFMEGVRKLTYPNWHSIMDVLKSYLKAQGMRKTNATVDLISTYQDGPCQTWVTEWLLALCIIQI